MPYSGFSVKEIKVDSILNKGKHADGGWFWMKYSAHPYIGCLYGCTYCVWRQDTLGISPAGNQTLSDPFSQLIIAKTNAAEILDEELKNVPKDVVYTTDYQPVEAKYGISRKMLEVCLKNKFPVVIVSKSPLVLRDIGLIKKISEKSWACVVFSISSAKTGGYREFFEPFASTIESRLKAMKKLSDEGIYTGTALLPILPFVSDNDENLEAVVKLTKENGGKFVMAGGLVLGGNQKEFFYESLSKFKPELVEKYKALYGEEFSPKDDSWKIIGRKVRELCKKYGLDYRIKRYIPDDKLATNKKIAEEMYRKVYDLETGDANESRINLLRSVAERIDSLTVPLDELFSGFQLQQFLAEDKLDEILKLQAKIRASGEN